MCVKSPSRGGDFCFVEPLCQIFLAVSHEATLRGSLHASEACTLRRSQILLASAEGKTPRQIARQVGCTDQTVRNVIRAFEWEGGGCLQQKSSAPKTRKPELEEGQCEQLRAILHFSPG